MMWNGSTCYDFNKKLNKIKDQKLFVDDKISLVLLRMLPQLNSYEKFITDIVTSLLHGFLKIFDVTRSTDLLSLDLEYIGEYYKIAIFGYLLIMYYHRALLLTELKMNFLKNLIKEDIKFTEAPLKDIGRTVIKVVGFLINEPIVKRAVHILLEQLIKDILPTRLKGLQGGVSTLLTLGDNIKIFKFNSDMNILEHKHQNFTEIGIDYVRYKIYLKTLKEN